MKTILTLLAGASFLANLAAMDFAVVGDWLKLPAGRPMIGDTCLEGGGTLSFRKTLTSIYPQARAGDRLCYVLGWRTANRSLRHVRSCLLIG